MGSANGGSSLIKVIVWELAVGKQAWRMQMRIVACFAVIQAAPENAAKRHASVISKSTPYRPALIDLTRSSGEATQARRATVKRSTSISTKRVTKQTVIARHLRRSSAISRRFEDGSRRFDSIDLKRIGQNASQRRTGDARVRETGYWRFESEESADSTQNASGDAAT